jgi:hypothetical protein
MLGLTLREKGKITETKNCPREDKSSEVDSQQRKKVTRSFSLVAEFRVLERLLDDNKKDNNSGRRAIPRSLHSLFPLLENNEENKKKK